MASVSGVVPTPPHMLSTSSSSSSGKGATRSIQLKGRNSVTVTTYGRTVPWEARLKTKDRTIWSHSRASYYCCTIQLLYSQVSSQYSSGRQGFLAMEAPLHPTPMARPMMKGKIYVDASNKPTFQVRERAVNIQQPVWDMQYSVCCLCILWYQQCVVRLPAFLLRIWWWDNVPLQDLRLTLRVFRSWR